MKFQRVVCFLILCFTSVSINVFAQNAVKPMPLTITQVTENIFVFTTYGVFKESYFPSNGLIAVGENEVVLIDTPWDTSQVKPLLDSIQVRFKRPVVACISTHFHDDRTGGIPQLSASGITTYTSDFTDSLCTKFEENRAENTFSKDTVFKFNSLSFSTFYPGKGHAPDNIVVWFPKEKVLYGGCFVKSTESKNLGYLGDADPISWLESIQLVIKKYPTANFVVPGHQNGFSTAALFHTERLIEEYLKKQK